MNRRGFVKLVTAVLAAGWVKPEKAMPRAWPLVDGANQSGPVLATDGWGQYARISRGDTFTISYADEVNPFTHRPIIGRPKLFIVTADVDADEHGRAMLPICPSLHLTGQYCNVSGIYNDAILTPMHGWGASAYIHSAEPSG